MEKILEVRRVGISLEGSIQDWVRVLKKQEKNRKGVGGLREKVGGGTGIAGHWVLGAGAAGIARLELVL